jgi:phosphatidylcholine synthase
VASAIVVLGSGLAFVPFKWVHPLRVRALRGVTLAFTGLWAIAAMTTLYVGFPALPGVKAVLAVVAGYGVGLALLWRWLGQP